jgi:DNA invertase Pin-like site-specific DNA recombinase
MIRFAILAGVSSAAQATEERQSIPDQIRTCRRVIQQYQGAETACYTFDGYSRSGYDSLAEAMAAIPALQTAVQDAEKDCYDVLMVDNWDRLGDLGLLLYTRFRKLKKQIYSARQSGTLYDPQTYNPYGDESGNINMHIQGILQTYRINKIRRGWDLGIPARVERGLHPLSLAFGYRLNGKNQPAQLVPEKAALLRAMKDMMLAGKTYTEIALYADTSGIKPRRTQKWNRVDVKRILLNPYNAGIVRFGYQRHRLPAPRAEWKLGQGKHEPLWDEETYYALVAEAKRRLEGKRFYQARYPFSGIPVCGICGKKLRKSGKPPWEYLGCDTTRKHWAMRYEPALQFLANAVVTQFREHQSAPHEPLDLAPFERQRKELEDARTLIQDGYRSRIYKADEAAREIAKIETSMEEVLQKMTRARQEEANWLERQEQREELHLDDLPELLEVIDPGKLNAQLQKLIRKIVVMGDQAIVVWQD